MDQPTDKHIDNAVKKTLGYVSIHGVVALIALSILSGYLLGWSVQAVPGMTGAGALIAIIFGWVIRKPTQMWAIWLDSKPTDQIVSSVKSELGIGKQDKEKKKDKDSFNEFDFDEVAKVMLLKMVRQSRKDGVLVTGQQLITTILKSIK
jgi:hypothetical protein